MGFSNNVISAILLLTIGTGYEANGLKYCSDSFSFSNTCDDDQYCCGINMDRCCNDFPKKVGMQFEQALAIVILIMIVCAPIYCCYRCCRRTSNPGFVYSPADTAPVTVTMPPQQGQVPYPSVMPYPQQTPYPVQQPTNPYYGGPPPPYHMVQSNFQNASAPTF